MHTRFIFAGERFCFWQVKFLTKRGPLIIRVPEDQAPMVALEAIRRKKEEQYLAGTSNDRLQDPWEVIEPISHDRGNIQLAYDWVKKFGEKFGFEYFEVDERKETSIS